MFSTWREGTGGGYGGYCFLDVVYTVHVMCVCTVCDYVCNTGVLCLSRAEGTVDDYLIMAKAYHSDMRPVGLCQTSIE